MVNTVEQGTDGLNLNDGTTTVPLTQVTPGSTVGNSQINIQDYGGQIAHDPQVGFSNDMLLGNNTQTITEDQTQDGQVAEQPLLDISETNADTTTVDTAAQANLVDPRNAVGFDTATTEPAVTDMTAAQGTVSGGAQVDIREIDTEATGRGENEVGKALNKAAVLDLNDVDTRATLRGQLEILQDDFKDNNDNPVIPPWASGLARNVQKIAAFKGITGTAATEALSNALLESSIKVAEQDAKFFQTVSLTNLSNKQQQTINMANVLAQMDMRNLDARTTAAVENAKNFMQMDLTNLSNEQQAQVINTQQRFQSILEDARQENTSRMFLAQSENDMAKYYDQLNSQLSQFNATQTNAMSQFNANEINDTSQFNAQLENNRDQFYREMQYNVDVANAQWRQTVTTTNTEMLFEAAAFDARNMVNMSQEQLNQLWDRSDSLLDYLWRSTESELDRDAALVVAQLQAGTSRAVAEAGQPGFLDVVGNIAGALLGRWLG